MPIRLTASATTGSVMCCNQLTNPPVGGPTTNHDPVLVTVA